MPSIDYTKLKESLPLAHVMDVLKVHYLQVSLKYARGRCPLGCSRHTRACNFNLHRQLWYCHRCRQGGSPIDLAMNVLRMDAYTAATKLCELLNVPVPYVERSANNRRLRPVRGRKDVDIGDDDEVS